MKKTYEIGFDCGEWFNGICCIRGRAEARELAAEVETEYGKAPTIREWKPEYAEYPHK